MDSHSRSAVAADRHSDAAASSEASRGDPEPSSPDRPLGPGRFGRAFERATTLLRGVKRPAPDMGKTEFLSATDAAAAKEMREERRLMQNVMTLRDLRVEDVMVPRADIVAVESMASLDEVLEAFREGAHSRLPVYRETLDDPIGVVHLKDLALSHGFGAGANDFSLDNHLRSVLAVPASMKVRVLLERMQASRRHMAVVIDEYGGVDGLVTIEDIIEQIVGAIEDEHDDAEGPLWRRQPDGAYLAEARAYVDEFQDATGAQLLLEDWEEDVDTLGGLIFMICGRVPERGEVIRHPLGHEFEIVDADPRRIKRVRVRLVEPDSENREKAEEAASTRDETRQKPKDEAAKDGKEPAAEKSETKAQQPTDDDLADVIDEALRLEGEALRDHCSDKDGDECPDKTGDTPDGRASKTAA